MLDLMLKKRTEKVWNPVRPYSHSDPGKEKVRPLLVKRRKKKIL